MIEFIRLGWLGHPDAGHLLGLFGFLASPTVLGCLLFLVRSLDGGPEARIVQGIGFGCFVSAGLLAYPIPVDEARDYLILALALFALNLFFVAAHAFLTPGDQAGPVTVRGFGSRAWIAAAGLLTGCLLRATV